MVSVQPTPLDTSETSIIRVDPMSTTGLSTRRSYQHLDHGRQLAQASQPQRPPPQATSATHNRAISDVTQDSHVPFSDVSIIASLA
ncbi:hypothetical protein SERLA73DRAFT_135949, partial [Serpula lacrymans var. lacrymans S7.3]